MSHESCHNEEMLLAEKARLKLESDGINAKIATVENELKAVQRNINFLQKFSEDVQDKIQGTISQQMNTKLFLERQKLPSHPDG